MKRVTVVVLVVIGLALSGMAFAQQAEKKPDATLKLTQGQVAVGIGWSWGNGVLSFKGKEYPFKVQGLSVGDVGVSNAEAEGKVYNLKKLEDFDGKYLSGSAQATLGPLGRGATAMENDKGVVLHLFPKTEGINLKLAGEGVKFTLEKGKK